MPTISIAAGLVLIAIGCFGYFGSESQSPTALIPAAFGLVFAVAGAISLQNDKVRKHAMHAVAMLALLGFLAAGFMAGKKLAGGAELNLALKSQLAMAVVCLIVEVMCVRSFIEARRRRQSAATST